jgi:hypothetical protein
VCVGGGVPGRGGGGDWDVRSNGQGHFFHRYMEGRNDRWLPKLRSVPKSQQQGDCKTCSSMMILICACLLLQVKWQHQVHEGFHACPYTLPPCTLLLSLRLQAGMQHFCRTPKQQRGQASLTAGLGCVRAGRSTSHFSLDHLTARRVGLTAR